MKKAALLTLALGLVIGATVMSSCKKSKSSSTTTMTLYDTLGGTTMVTDPSNTSVKIEAGRLALRSVVDSAIFVIAGDTQLQKYFTVLLAEVTAGNLTGFDELSGNLTDFFAVATGAKDYTYSGKSMTDAHNPATNSRMAEKADSADFNEFIGDVVIAAQKNNVPTAIIGRLGTVMYSIEGQVVQR